jgi:hypothetical protein
MDATMPVHRGNTPLRSVNSPAAPSSAAKLIGAVVFLITLLTVVAGTGEDSVFGYGFLPGILALAIWSIATSIARYRALATTARGLGDKTAA